MTPKFFGLSLITKTKCRYGLIIVMHPSLWLISHLPKYWSFCLADIEASRFFKYLKSSYDFIRLKYITLIYTHEATFLASVNQCDLLFTSNNDLFHTLQLLK